MPPEVDVTVRLGDDVLAVDRVTGRTFRAGTAPGVDLALDLAPLSAFPLVDATGEAPVVRWPVGVPAVRHDAAGATRLAETELRLAAGQRVELRFGAVVVELGRAEPAVRVPPPAAELRFAAYAAGSLAVHVAVWAIAVAVARPPRRIARVRPRRIARIASAVLPEPKPKPKPKPNPNPNPTPQPQPQLQPQRQPGMRAAGRRNARREARTARAAASPLRELTGGDGGEVGDAVQALVAVEAGAEAKIAQAGPLYDPDSTFDRAFGGGSVRRFDPWLGITLCGDGCAVTGPLGQVAVEHGLDASREALAACAASADGGGEVVLDLDIGADGAVRDARATGLGAVGPCVAAVARGVAFPPDAVATHARVPITFRAR